MAKVGKIASVKLGTYKVSGMGTFTLSGFTRDVLEDTEFGDDIKTFMFGLGTGGTLSFSGLYDPTDSTGQVLLDSACKNSSTFTGGDLKLYIDNTSYLTVDTGGNILITKCKAITMEKNGLGQCSFEGTISGGAMVLI